MKSMARLFARLSFASFASGMPILAQLPPVDPGAPDPSAVSEPAGPLQVGAGHFQLPAHPAAVFTYTIEDPIVVFTYKPPTYRNGPLLVVCHGAGHDAEAYRDHAIVLAERFNAIVAAPLFDWDRFKEERYQEGGILRNGQPQAKNQWTFAVV